MATMQAVRQKITLAGSAAMIVEFFEYSVNSILFQRNIYAPEDFTMVKKYGLNMLVTTDDGVKAYLKQICKQLEAWMNAGKISRLVLAIKSKDTLEVLERWQFDIIQYNQNNKENVDGLFTPPKEEKSVQKVHQEIQAIIRQITASVSFLPMLEEKCTFNILVYADKDVEVPTTWEDSDPLLLKGGGEHVKLRSFSTNFHKVDALVAYRRNEHV